MGKLLKRYDSFIKENAVEVEPIVKPKTAPKTTPTRRSPLRRDEPSVTPKPKAEDVAKKFLALTKGNKEVRSMLNKKYK